VKNKQLFAGLEDELKLLLIDRWIRRERRQRVEESIGEAKMEKDIFWWHYEVI
jgi:uncharacterized protein YdgA (DUF945 family)